MLDMTIIGLTWWWPLLLLPLPLVVRRLLPSAQSNSLAITVPLLNYYPISSSSLNSAQGRLPQFTLWFLWICIVLAAARPFLPGDPVNRTVSGRDLILAIDISGSMQEVDMMLNNKTASRIDVLKEVASEFIDRRTGDRIGLILFGTRAYTYVPLTYDRKALSELLSGVTTGLAGRLTAIGDAIGIAIKTLSQQPSRHKVLILVSDGSNTSGKSDPLDSVQIAKRVGMTIHTIGVGNDAKELRRILKTQTIPPGTALNETLLRQIAALSGGQYFRAKDTESLERIYKTLDELEPVPLEVHLHRPKIELFHLPLMSGLGWLLIFIVYSIVKSARTQTRMQK